MAISDCSAHVQHIRKYLPELLSLISELWSSFSLPAANRSGHGSPVSMASFKYCYVVFILTHILNNLFGTLVYDLRLCI